MYNKGINEYFMGVEKMYKVSVPIINMTAQEMGLESILESLKRLDAKRVFLICAQHS